MFDLIIKNGTIIDGTQAERYPADLGITADRIAQIGELDAAEAHRVLDAAGKFVAPGFIDVHTHADGWLLKKPNFFSKTSQGFTTEVIMADGISYAPVSEHTAVPWMHYMRTLNGLLQADYEGWRSVADYMALLDGRSAQNAISHVPYANVRTLACGFGRRGPDDVQMMQIQAEIERAMAEGAVGLSTGLDYIVQCWATTDELVEACRPLAAYNGLYVTHVRYKKGILAAVKEAVEIGKRAGVAVHISHLKGGVPGQDQVADELLTYIDEVATQEVDFTFDVYPYMATSTMLNSLLPYEAWEEGPFGVAQKLLQPEIKVRFGVNLARLDLDNTYIAWVASKENSEFQGQSLRAYSEAIGMTAVDACTNLLLEENLAVLLVFRIGEDDLVDPYLSHGRFMLGSDGIYHDDGTVHPRQYGSATRMLGACVRDKNLFSLEEAVFKMTSFPAQRFGLSQRGEIKEGYFADLVVFDAATVADQATLERPMRFSTGIEHVLVNGRAVVKNGAAVEGLERPLPGRALRYRQ